MQVTPFNNAVVKGQGRSGDLRRRTQGVVTTCTHVAYALGYIVTFEELRDNLYKRKWRRGVPRAAFSMRQTTELVATIPYNTAFVTTNYHW